MKNCDFCKSVEANAQSFNFELNDDRTYYILSSTVYNTDLVVPELFEGKPVREIGENAFANCHFLTGITVPDGVKIIGDKAFSSCEKLASVKLGKGLKRIGQAAFKDCNSLEKIYYTGDLASWCAILGLENLPADCTVFINGKPLTGDLYIPFGVTEISDCAFRGRKAITKANFPSSVTKIGDKAFCYCRGLTELNISSGMIAFCDYAFWGCKALTVITFNGTKSQWTAIAKGNEWNGSSCNYTVRCLDGVLDKYGNEIVD